MAGPFFFRLAMTRSYLGHQREAAEAAERAMKEAERSGERAIAGQARYVLALKSYLEGEPRCGVEQARQAIALLEGTDQSFWLGVSHWALAMNHAMIGEVEAARRAAAEAEAIGNATGEARLQSLAAATRGWALAARGDGDAGIEACRRSLDVSRDPVATAGAWIVLGSISLEQEDYRAALAALQQAEERLRGFGMGQAAGRAMALLGDAYLGAGDLERATEMADRAVAVSRESASRWALGWAQRTRGRIARARGSPEVARRHLEEALATFSAIDARFEAGRTELDLAEVAHALGDQARARDGLAAAMRGFQDLELPRRVEQAAALARRLAIEVGAPSR